jgi:hypothetical protein
VRSIQFEVQGRPFLLVSDAQGRKVVDRNGVEWSDVELSDAFGETEATTALAYALRDLERFTAYRVPDER